MAVGPERFLGRSAKLDAIVGQDDPNLVWNGSDQSIEECPRRCRGGLVNELGESVL